MLSALFKALLGLIFPKLFGDRKDPSGIALADSNARAQERLAAQEKVNEVTDKAAAARTAAAARIVRERKSGGGNEGLDRNPNAFWRD